MQQKNKIKSGLLVPLFSLPSDSGIGELGGETEDFLFLLNKHNVGLWQILPITPLDCGNSPYSSIASYGIDPIYISLEKLNDMGYDLKVKSFRNHDERVDYDAVREYKEPYLREAYDQFINEWQPQYDLFIHDNRWAFDVAEFRAKHIHFNKTKWNTWEEKNVDLSNEINYQVWLQFIAVSQFEMIKELANRLNIDIIGDIPFYCGYNSVDVYKNPQYFYLDKKNNPSMTAGVPPDYFNENGQNWNNPVWNFDKLSKNNYSLFIDRLAYACEFYDCVRLDHSRALASYYTIPVDDKPINGKWNKLDGKAILDKLYEEYPPAELILEDLGADSKCGIYDIMKDFKLPGMKVLEFHMLNKEVKGNNVIYTGTHDNQGVLSWYDNLNDDDKNKINIIIGSSNIARVIRDYEVDEDYTISQKLIAYALAQNTVLSVISIIDILELKGEENRINYPGTISNNNWTWRFEDLDDLDDKLELYLFDPTDDEDPKGLSRREEKEILEEINEFDE